MPERRGGTSVGIKQKAKELRRESTLAEKILWTALRGRKLNGIKFCRQHPIGSFIADFYCVQYRLVVEIDGEIHKQQQRQDLARTEWLEQHGYRVIRFRNHEVEQNLENVCSETLKICQG